MLAPNCTTLDQPRFRSGPPVGLPGAALAVIGDAGHALQASSSAGLGLRVSCSPSPMCVGHRAVLVGELHRVRCGGQSGSFGASDQRRRAAR